MKKYISEVLSFSSRLLFPRVCPVCGEILTEKNRYKEKNPFICRKCYFRLHFPEEPRCLWCSRPVDSEDEEFCPECRQRRRYFDQGAALMMHDEAAKKILYDLKFSNKRDNADMPAYEAAGQYAGMIRFWNPSVLIPVPLHKKKELERGFNQASLLAYRLSFYLKEEHCIDIPVNTDCLKRIHYTKAQKELGKAGRQENIRGAFDVDQNCSSVFCGKTVLLVDDIYTTGATLSECAYTLKKYGAEQVYFLTFSIV